MNICTKVAKNWIVKLDYVLVPILYSNLRVCLYDRFLTLMKKHSAGVREKDLVDCLCDVSDHYTHHVSIWFLN